VEYVGNVVVFFELFDEGDDFVHLVVGQFFSVGRDADQFRFGYFNLAFFEGVAQAKAV